MRRWIFGVLATFGVTAAIAVPLLTGAASHRGTMRPSGFLGGWIDYPQNGHLVPVRILQSIANTELKAEPPTPPRVGR